MDNSTENSKLHLPYTIEQQLQAYTLHPRATERHHTLWHAWNQDKGWLTHFLELTLAAFPSYSRHDATHANMVLHNIELILGEERIRQLSATDCFLLLHVVFVHDIGMCITTEDRKNAVISDEFSELIKSYEHSDDVEKTRWAACLKQYRYDYMENCSNANEEKAYRQLYTDKLDVYNSLIHLIAEYIRGHHGERGKERLIQWTTDKEKLGAGFSFSGIPNRIFSRMAECAGLHTVWEFEKILELPQEDNGYAHDRMHPRFIAVLLQLGDALDIDNDRFHPFVLDLVGQLPGISELHFQKHNAIRRLQITPTEINIAADCTSVDVLHMIRQECGWIEELLKNASYYWAQISPSDFPGCLPSMGTPLLQLNGASIPQELVTARFSIPQEKAFQLLEGSNVYGDYFPFLRELLQNAFDATKLQYFTDYRGSAYYQRKIQANREFHKSTFAISQKISPTDYPIEIFLTIQAINNSGHEVTEEYASEHPDDVDYGVLLEIQDHGIGMTQKDILAISQVGTSHSKQHELISEMPDILKPTGEFGIGLQSVFTVVPRFECITRAHNGEAYRIVFSEASRKNDGIINATPLADCRLYPFGTKFRVLVSRKNKVDHHKFLQAWAGIDYFEADYGNSHKLHEAEELMTQMIYYLEEIIGEKIFPICVIAKDPFSEQLPYNLKNTENGIDKFILSVLTKKNDQTFLLDTEKLQRSLAWAFKPHEVLAEQCRQRYEKLSSNRENHSSDGQSASQVSSHGQKVSPEKVAFFENDNLYGAFKPDWLRLCPETQQDEDRYYLDPIDWKLYLWCEEARTFACLSADRFLNKFYDTENNDGNAKLYYKGIKLHSTVNFPTDLGLIEYLDIKHGNTRKCLQLNRDQMTDEGKRYLQNEICPAVLKTAYNVMKYIANKIRKQDYEQRHRNQANSKDFIEEINEYIGQRIKEIDSDSKARFARRHNQSLLSLTLLAYFAKSCFLTNESQPCNSYDSNLSNNCPWERLLTHLSEHMSRLLPSVKDASSPPFSKEIEFLFVRCYGIHGNSTTDTLVNIASLLSAQDRYYIHSIRQHRQSFWQERIVKATLDVRIYEKNNSNSGSRNKRGVISDKDMDYALLLLHKSEQQPDMSNAELGLFSHESYSNYVAKWMLHNIATEKTMAYMEKRDDTGDMRLNLLTAGRIHEISFNNEMLYLLLRKMEERNELYNAQRFSTIVWAGMSCLEVTKTPSTVCEINRGFISSSSRPEMLLPLSAGDIKILLHSFEEKQNSMEGQEKVYVPKWKSDDQFTQKLKKIITAVNEFQKLMNATSQLRSAYDNKVESFSGQMADINTSCKFSELEVPELDESYTKKIEYYRTLSISGKSEEDRVALRELFDKIQGNSLYEKHAKLSAWLQNGLIKMVENTYLQNAELDKLKADFYDRNKPLKTNMENMIIYIQKNGVQKPSRDQIITLFLEIYDRFINAVRAVHKKELLTYVRKECSYSGRIEETLHI